MIKLFFSSPYHIKHKDIIEENACELLKDDIRSRLLGDTKKFVYASKEVPLKKNKNISYIGGFYYENSGEKEYQYGECENVVCAELEQIKRSDLVVINLLEYSAIATVTELVYAAFLKKKIIIFCHPDITQFQVEYEYWFPILTSLQINKENIEIRFVHSEDEIIKYLNSYKGEIL